MKAALIHPVEIKFRNEDKTATPYDADFNEPSGEVAYLAEQAVAAQVKIYKMSRVEGNLAGFELKGDGYVLLRETDFDKIELNAKVTSISGRSVEFFVNEISDATYYQEGAQMQRVYFERKGKGKTT
jgi:hypothetical protein